MANEGVDGYPCGANAKDYINKLMGDVEKLTHTCNEAQSRTEEAQEKSMRYIDKYFEALTEVNNKTRRIDQLQNEVEELEEQCGELQVQVNTEHNQVNTECNRADSYLAELNYFHELHANDDDGLFDGIAWLYLQYFPIVGGDFIEKAVSAQSFEIQVVSILGLNCNYWRVISVLGIIIGVYIQKKRIILYILSAYKAITNKNSNYTETN